MSDSNIVQWLIPGRVLYAPGTTDTAIMAERTRLTLELIEKSGQPPMVHTLIDHRNRYTPEQIASQPKSMTAYTKFADDAIRERLIAHPLFGWVISVATPNMGLKMAGRSQSRHYRWHSVDTWAEAIHFLMERDTTLTELPMMDVD